MVTVLKRMKPGQRPPRHADKRCPHSRGVHSQALAEHAPEGSGADESMRYTDSLYRVSPCNCRDGLLSTRKWRSTPGKRRRAGGSPMQILAAADSRCARRDAPARRSRAAGRGRHPKPTDAPLAPGWMRPPAPPCAEARHPPLPIHDNTHHAWRRRSCEGFATMLPTCVPGRGPSQEDGLQNAMDGLVGQAGLLCSPF